MIKNSVGSLGSFPSRGPLAILLLGVLVGIWGCGGPKSTSDGTETELSCDVAEICDGVDQNCNGEIDEGAKTTFYEDLDGDGFGNPDSTMEDCTAPSTAWVVQGDDCDDTERKVNPAAAEICNDLDDDCDGETDDDDADVTGTVTWYLDQDGDGFGVSGGTADACEMPEGYADNTDDCNDGNPAANPAGNEVCDGVDNNCDDAVDDNEVTYYLDSDGDGYGDPTQAQTGGCDTPSGYVPDNTDCADGDAAVHPGAIEVRNGADDNCNGGIDEGVISLSAGSYHSMVVLMDGTVWTWGYNYHGQLGVGLPEVEEGSGEDPRPLNSAVAIQVTSLSDCIQVSAGDIHSVALLGDGTVWAWGDNFYGQLGNGGGDDETSPILVETLSDIVVLAAGGRHTLALKADGTVWSWGSNQTGQLGTGMDKTDLPAMVPGLEDVMGVAAGMTFSMILKTDGTVWSWGNNAVGQLGDGTTDDSDTPVRVQNLQAVTNLAGGTVHTIARASDGTAWAWGLNSSGQLGDGTLENRLLPVQVLGLSGVVAVGAGLSNSGALLADGTAWFWGANDEGQLGTGDFEDSMAPVEVADLKDMMATTTGSYHTLAAGLDGRVWAWGSNTYGQLGNGAEGEDSSVPVQVQGLPE